MSDKTLRSRRIANELVEQSMEQFRRQRAGEVGPQPVVQTPVVQKEKRFEPGQGFHTVFSRIIGGGDDDDAAKDSKIHFLPPKEAYRKVETHQTENNSPPKVAEKTTRSSNSPTHKSVFERLSNHNADTEAHQPIETVLEDIEKPAKTENRAKDDQKPPASVFEKLSRGSSSK